MTGWRFGAGAEARAESGLERPFRVQRLQAGNYQTHTYGSSNVIAKSAAGVIRIAHNDESTSFDENLRIQEVDAAGMGTTYETGQIRKKSLQLVPGNPDEGELATSAYLAQERCVCELGNTDDYIDVYYLAHETAEAPIFVTERPAQAPSLRIDAAGHLHLAFVQEAVGETSWDVMYATNASGAWVAETVFEGVDLQPVNADVALALGPGDVPAIVFPHGPTIYIAEGGAAWGYFVVAEDATATSLDLEFAPSGVAHVAYTAWGSGFSGRLTYGTRAASGVFWTETTLEEGDASDVSLDVDSQEQPHLSYHRSDLDALAYAHRAGTTWHQQIVLTGAETDIVVGTSNDIVVDDWDVVYISSSQSRVVQSPNVYESDLLLAWSKDCNGNGVHDQEEIDDGLVPDCNGNGWPDGCDIALGFAEDCNANGIPDGCEVLLPLIVDGGFEETSPGSTPSDFGYWGHDPADAVTAENGIDPLEGDRMLKFLATLPGGASASAGACDVQQLVSLCEMTLGSEGVVAEATASFNRVAGDMETDTAFRIELRAYAGPPADFPSGSGSYLAESVVGFESDGDPATWEKLTATLVVPEGADYVAVWLVASENVFNDGVEPEFDGHYADAVTIEFCDPALQSEPELEDPSFEESDPVVGTVPDGVGYWGYDLSAAVGVENGIAPAHGAEMLSFLATSPTGADPDGGACDVIQLVSLCALEDLWSGDRAATVSARFNRVAGDAETDRSFGIRLRTYDGPPSGFTGGDGLSDSLATLLSDDDPGTWEEVSVSVGIPAGSQYLAIWLFASEDVTNDGVEPEFDGHYVDDVQLSFDGEIVSVLEPAPPAIAPKGPVPNPSPGHTTWWYVVEGGDRIQRRIYDATGRLVRDLGPGPSGLGLHRVTWDGRDERGHPVAPGVYFGRFGAPTTPARRVIILR